MVFGLPQKNGRQSWDVHPCISICMYIYIYIIRANIYTCIYVHTHININIYIYTYKYIYTYNIHIYTYIYIIIIYIYIVVYILPFKEPLICVMHTKICGYWVWFPDLGDLGDQDPSAPRLCGKKCICTGLFDHI